MEHEGDVAERAAERRPAGSAVQRGRDSAAVQQQDCLPAPVLDRPELLQQGPRERVARFATQIDDPHSRQGAAQPSAQLEALELVPAFGPRSRAAVDRDRVFEGRALRRDGPRVVTRVRLLLVRLVVLLVHADDADVAQRREDGRARADDDLGLTASDALPLVAALRVGQPGVEQGHGVSEPRLESPQRLRRQRDLGHEHDRRPAARQRRGARLEVDLGLAAAGLAVEQEMTAAGIERGGDPCQRRVLLARQLRRLRLVRKRLPLAGRCLLLPPLALHGRDQLQRPPGCRPIVVRHPQLLLGLASARCGQTKQQPAEPLLRPAMRHHLDSMLGVCQPQA